MATEDTKETLGNGWKLFGIEMLQIKNTMPWWFALSCYLDIQEPLDFVTTQNELIMVPYSSAEIELLTH